MAIDAECLVRGSADSAPPQADRKTNKRLLVGRVGRHDYVRPDAIRLLQTQRRVVSDKDSTSPAHAYRLSSEIGFMASVSRLPFARLMWRERVYL